MVLSRFKPGAFTPVPPQTIALVGTLVSFIEVDSCGTIDGHWTVEIWSLIHHVWWKGGVQSTNVQIEVQSVRIERKMLSKLDFAST